MNSLEETCDSPLAAALLRVRRERDEAREALRSIATFLEGGPDFHNRIGEACGVDACLVCLAEGTANAALKREAV